MRLSNLREGLEILSRYFNRPDGYHTYAEHDLLYVAAPDKPICDDDLKRLEELGWVFESDGWRAFT